MVNNSISLGRRLAGYKVPVVFYGPEDSKMGKFIFIGTFLMLLIIIADIVGIAFAG